MRLPRAAILVGGLSIALAVPAIAVAQAGTTPRVDQSPSYIVGGRNATETYSFMASLQAGGRHFCGAALIKANWVATAKHCVQSRSAGSFNARIGTVTYASGGTLAGTSRVVLGGGDFALVQLSTSVSQRPVPIPDTSGAVGTATRIIGWGQTCAPQGCGGAPSYLQELNTSIVADSRCSGISAATEICTNNPNGNSGACYGDSGGPQIRGSSGNWLLIGTTSRSGNGSSVCATGPSIYNDVPAFRSWIISIVGSLDDTPGPTPTASPTGPPPGGCDSHANRFSGSLSSGGQAYQPNNSYFQTTSSGTHSACLDGPTGTDFDLYLQKWNGSSWANVASGASPGPDESLTYTGTAGYYRYRVHAYSGSGSYALGYTRPA